MKTSKRHYALILLSLGMVVLLFVVRSGLSSIGPSSTSAADDRELEMGAGASALPLLNNGTVGDEEEYIEEGMDLGTVVLKNNIRQISLIGERNSGTRWTWSLLSKCFNHSIPVEKKLARYKHWFQYEDNSLYPEDTLVIAQFRNPIDWLKAMQHVPHHSPSHLPGPQFTWKEFLTTPWTTERIGVDLQIAANHTEEELKDYVCQQRFKYNDIVSCITLPKPISEYNYRLRYSEEEPFYELRNDGSGLPYNNIMDMRADKIRNFLEIKNWPTGHIADVWVVQYEYLLRKGTSHLINKISEYTGIEPHCTPPAPQLRRQRNIEPHFLQHVIDNINWTVEEEIGYRKPSIHNLKKFYS